MNALNNMIKNQIPQDIIMSYLELYESIGKNAYYEESFLQDMKRIINHQKQVETFYFYHLFYKNRKISEARFKALLEADAQPKTKDEILFCNIKTIFNQIFDSLGTFHYTANEIQDMVQLFGRGVFNKEMLEIQVEKGKKTRLEQQKEIQLKKIELENILNKFNELMKKSESEISFIAINLFVDLINYDYFKELSEPIFLLVFYVILLQNHFDCFKYFSFFELLIKYRKEYDNAIIQAKFNYQEGFPIILPLHRLMLKIFNETYEKLGLYMRDYLYDQKQKKTDYIENTINKLGDIFSKEEICNAHPFVSVSTIQRTLTRMRDEGLIRPLGTGRSAKWMKLYESEKKLDFTGSQIKFNLEDEKNE